MIIAYLTVLIFYLAVIGVFVLAWWRVWEKAGFRGAWSLLMFVPIVNIASFFYLAFAEWPVHRMLRGPDDEF
ncbi:hypothetical protein [Henriciella aquimarina]|uniref:hypothetical protein n=1 Tax=Henriciella aquimarina TaxID=545261 RepID=UPI0009FE08C1|nr:hypothetical protein [Henriciella aquimarina]